MTLYFLHSLYAKRWKKYDPDWLVTLAREQQPEHQWLADSLLRCRRAKKESDYYLYFVDGSAPNRKGSAWQFSHNITLEHPLHGEIVVDILKGNKVGGIEFLGLLLDDT